VDAAKEGADRMISRIRLDAYGGTAGQCEQALLAAASSIDNALWPEQSGPAYGAQVIERNLVEPMGSKFAFQGRLVLHPDLGSYEEDLGPARIGSHRTEDAE
jgi:hypothetical protein